MRQLGRGAAVHRPVPFTVLGDRGTGVRPAAFTELFSFVSRQAANVIDAGVQWGLVKLLIAVGA